MTRKEKVEAVYPEFIHERFGGGVSGCPGTYPELKLGEQANCGCGCDACWNMEVEEDDAE
jgi:hypothetical protein